VSWPTSSCSSYILLTQILYAVSIGYSIFQLPSQIVEQFLFSISEVAAFQELVK